MTTDALREKWEAREAAAAKLGHGINIRDSSDKDAVQEFINADFTLITAQQARIAALEAERDAALLLADALDKALQAEGVNDVIAQLRLSVFRRKLDAQLRDGISSPRTDEDAAGGST